MILGHSITIQTASETITGEGIKSRSWSTFKSVKANAQPLGLQVNRAFPFTLLGNELAAYLYRDLSITEEMRAVYAGVTYEIRAVIHWNIHTEMILVPIAGMP